MKRAMTYGIALVGAFVFCGRMVDAPTHRFGYQRPASTRAAWGLA